LSHIEEDVVDQLGGRIGGLILVRRPSSGGARVLGARAYGFS